MGNTKEELAEDILYAVSDAWDCLEGEYATDIYGTCDDIGTIQTSLIELLPKIGIFAWLYEDRNMRLIKHFASEEEAENGLSADVKEKTDKAIEMDSSYDPVPHDHADSITLDTGEDTAYWKRFYNIQKN